VGHVLLCLQTIYWLTVNNKWYVSGSPAEAHAQYVSQYVMGM